MQFKDLFRSIIIILCFITSVTSCITTNKEVGENFIPSSEKVYLGQESIPIPLTINTMSDIQGINTSYMVLGTLRTEEYGEANFSTAANFAIASNINFGKNAKIKSVFLAIPVSGVKYINPDQEGLAENITVYRTNKVIDSAYCYQNSITPADYDSEPISLNSTTFLGNDSLIVYLNNSLGEEILTATKNQLDSSSAFTRRFKGLYIVSEPMLAQLNGGRVSMLNLSYAKVALNINFTPTWKSGLSAKDTTVYIKLGDGFCSNQAKYNSKLNSLVGNTDLKELPFEGIGGMKPYISAASLKQTLDKWISSKGYDPSRIVVNKARFILPYTPPVNYDYSNYPTLLSPVYRDTLSYHYFYPIDDISNEQNKGEINTSLNIFTTDCSSIIQKFILKSESALKNGGNDLWFALIDEIKDSYYGTTNYSLNTNTFYLGKINGPASDNAPRIELLYTVIND